MSDQFAQMATPAQLNELPPLPDDLPPLPAAQPPVPTMGGQMPERGDGIPIFEVVPRRNADGSYSNVEMVSILTPGDTKAVPRHKVTDVHKQRYRERYIEWRRFQEAAPVGTPLEMWPVMTPARVMQLKSVNIFTVEQLAEVSDSNLHSIPMGRDARNQARAWLETKKDADDVENKRREKEELMNGLRALEDKLEAMAAENRALKAEKAETQPKSKAKG
jgi:hypothetical protein